MKLDYLKEKKELVATALFAVSALSLVLIVLKVTDFFVTSANAEETVNQAIEQSEPDANNVKAQLGKIKKVADALKKQNLFSPPPPPQNPVKAVMGVFGDEAFINGKWYKAGAKVADAKIVAVTPTAVTVEWNGRKTVFNPIDGGASSGPGGPSRPGRPRPGSSGSRPGGATMVRTEGPRPGGGGGGMPDMRGMRERMMNMSEAERDKARAQMRERFENMSEADRDRFRQEMRERMGGGRGGPGGDRGGRGGGPGGGRGGR